MTPTRREFLKAAAALPIVGPIASASQPKSGYVDAHSHIWSNDVKKWPLAGKFTPKDLKPETFTDEELLKICRPAGVNRVVLIQHNVYHEFDNRYIAWAIKKHPGVFSGVAVIDHTKGEVEPTMLTLKKQGIRGFRILPRKLKPNEWLKHEGMQQMWKTAAANGLAMCPLINPEYLPSVNTMCKAFPNTRVVVDHFARIGVDGKIRDEDLENLLALAKHKNVLVKISAYYALGKKKPPYADLLPMIKRCIDAFGCERLMWGSDCPYQLGGGHSYKASLDLVVKGVDFVSDGDREWLLRRTAERVFFAS